MNERSTGTCTRSICAYGAPRQLQHRRAAVLRRRPGHLQVLGAVQVRLLGQRLARVGVGEGHRREAVGRDVVHDEDARHDRLVAGAVQGAHPHRERGVIEPARRLEVEAPVASRDGGRHVVEATVEAHRHRRQPAAADFARVLELRFRHLVPAHGEIIRDTAHAQLAATFARDLGV